MSHPVRIVNNKLEPKPVHRKESGILHGFSRSMDFAVILIPMAFGVGGLILKTLLNSENPILDLYYFGAIKTQILQDRSLLFGLFTYAVFLFGISSAVWLVRSVERILDQEE